MNDLKTLFKSIIVCFMLMLCGSVRAESGSYTIVFGNKLKGPQPLNSTISAATTISEGLEYVELNPYTVDVGNCYYGDSTTCIRIGKSGKTSKLTISLSKTGQVHATNVKVRCKCYGTSNNWNATLAVNGAASQTTSVNEKVHEFELNTDIEEIILEGSAAILIYSITVNYDGGSSLPERKDPGLAFNPTSITIVSGESLVAPTLTNNGDGEVEFSVDNKSVVKVDSLTGALTVMGSGTATVTAISKKTAYFLADTASYTVTILPKDIIDLRGKSESITFTDFHCLGDQYTMPIQGGLMANDNVVYGGWRKLDCMSTSDNLLALKKACGVFASPIIKSDRGVKLVVTCGSWVKNFKMEMDGATETTSYGSGLYQKDSLSTSSTETSFFFYAGSGSTVVKSIEIIPFTEDDIPLPSFSVAGGCYHEAQTVSLNVAGGYTIYYSTDGSDPSIEYTEPISVTSSSSIKAIAKDGEGNESEVAKATYTIESIGSMKTYEGIGALINARPTVKCILKLTNAQVLYASGTNVYVRDETGAMTFYKCGLLYEQGQILNGSVIVSYLKYHDIPEVTSVSDNQLVATEGTAVPKEVAVSDVSLKNYVCDYVKVRGIYDGSSEFSVLQDNYRLYISNQLKIYDINLSTVGHGAEVEVSGIVVPYTTSDTYYWSQPKLAVMKIEVITPAPLSIPTYNNIDDLISAAPKGRFYLMLNDAQVLYAGANDMYVKDATGTINFYECGLEYKTGQVLNGKILAHYEHFRRLIPEISKVTEQQVTAVDGTAFPLDVSSTDILGGEYTSEFVTTTGTLVIDAENGMNYLSDGTTQVSIYNNRFNLPDIDLTKYEEGTRLTVTGIVVPKSSYPNPSIPQIALLSIGTTSAEVNYYGDCNLDGSVNISDVVQLVNYILGNGDGSGVFSMLNADVNGDRNVNIIDVVEVVNMILNNELRPRTNSGTSE